MLLHFIYNYLPVCEQIKEAARAINSYQLIDSHNFYSNEAIHQKTVLDDNYFLVIIQSE